MLKSTQGTTVFRFLFKVIGIGLSLLLGGNASVYAVSILHSYEVIETPMSDIANMQSSFVPASPGISNMTTFNPTFGAGAASSIQFKTSFKQATDDWAALLNDQVTIRLSVDYKPLGSGILGQSSATLLWGGYDAVRDLVSFNPGEVNTARENALLPNLPTSSEFSAYLPPGFSMPGYSALTLANYHALGGTGFDSYNDDSITFSSNFAWDFDRSDGIAPGKYDFVGIAMHEIGHSLGFTSAVDDVDYMLAYGDPAKEVYPMPLDFFRFRTSDLSDPSFDFTDTPRVLEPGAFTPGGSQSFYYGDGSVLMSTGTFYGNGRQASHWQDNLGLGIMDPTAAHGELLSVTDNDLVALDLIGWDVNYGRPYSAQTPLPPTCALFLFGIIGIAGVRKRLG